MLRLGLCCMFRDAPIRFATTTATAMLRLPREQALARLSALGLANAKSLHAAFEYCVANQIGCFRVLSQILPVKTHPTCGYSIDELPDAELIRSTFVAAGQFAREQGLRTCFHPDQFVVLNSPRPEVVAASLRELEAQAEIAEWIGADVINLHGGGAYGDKPRALAELARCLDQLSPRVRARLTVENDDKIYTVADLLPVCRVTGIPLVYDVHHHRCLPDDLTIEVATQEAQATWNREPLFHISSPQDGWDGPKPERHHDLIDIRDFPECWRDLTVTVEVEARAKEAAVAQLRQDLVRTKPPKSRARRP